jgi:hypothetical protein
LLNLQNNDGAGRGMVAFDEREEKGREGKKR